MTIDNFRMSAAFPGKMFRKHSDKLVFARSLELSLRDQSADWSWQSPNNSGRFVRAFVRFSDISEDPGDCHVAALLAMTAFLGPPNTNLTISFSFFPKGLHNCQLSIVNCQFVFLSREKLMNHSQSTS